VRERVGGVILPSWYRPVQPWLFWAGFFTVAVGVLGWNLLEIPIGNGGTFYLGVVVGLIGLILLSLSYASGQGLPDVTRRRPGDPD